MSCQTCFNVEVPECPSSILLKAGLQANTAYYIWITDKFGEVYKQSCTSDANGSVLLSVSGIPTGTLNRHAGNFIIEARLADSNCEPELMQFCCDGVSTNYSCVCASFVQASESSQVIIGCICNDPISPAEPSSTQTFDFTNVDTVTCVHGLGRFVDVTIYDSSGAEIYGEVTQDPLNLNQVVISFNSVLSGKVIID